MPIPWDAENMSTGQPDIDEQHQEWIRAFNGFEQIVKEGKGQAKLQDALYFFSQYAERHFALEEARMRTCKCPADEANRAGHDQFRQMISLMRQQVQQSEIQFDLVVALQIELANWLIDHICTVDTELRSC